MAEHNSQTRWTTDLHDNLLRLILAGNNSNEIAEKLGRSVGAIEYQKLRHTKELISRGRIMEDAVKLTQLSVSMIEENRVSLQSTSSAYFDNILIEESYVEDAKYQDGKQYALVYQGNDIYIIGGRI